MLMVTGWRELLIDDVVKTYGFENPKTIRFFEILRTGNDEKLIKYYKQITGRDA